MEQESQYMLVIIGATPEGKKQLVGFTDGYRESTQSPLSGIFNALPVNGT